MGTEQEEIVCRLEDMEDTEVLFRYRKGEEKYLTNLMGDELSVRMGLICLIKKMAEVEDVPPIAILGELVTMELNRVKTEAEVESCPVTAFHAIPDAGESE